MSAVSGAIPNLVGGVSQQPSEIRALNTSTALVNTWSDVATGLSTRPYGRYVGSIGPIPSGANTVATHVINKPSGRYQISVYGGNVYVTNLSTGALQTVSVVEGGEYLNTADAARNIGFVTVGDTTFIYNRSVTITKTTSSDGSGATGLTESGISRLNPDRYSTVWLKQKAGYDSLYTVYRNGGVYGSFEADSDDTPAKITNQLVLSLNANSVVTERPSQTVISIAHPGNGYVITTEDGYSNQALFAYDDSIEEFTDLPNNDINGRLVRIRHSPEDDADDYWVWRKNNVWEETYGWNAKETIDASRMPIILVDNRNGTWTLKRTAWAGRTVGDAESNPTPSFVGRTINHMFIHKNRMCILADENFIASRVGEFENFYRSTCTQLLDDEPIDIAAPEGAGGPLYHAKEFDKGLLLFSEFDQFKIDGDSEGLLSPNTVSIRHTNSYNCSARVSPVYIGPDILFVDDFGPTGYATVREYQVERVFGREVALPVTDQVPEYIPTGVYKMAASSTDNIVALLSSNNRRLIWVYNYYFNNEGKVQSAWQQWELPGPVYSIEFYNDRLMVTLAFGGTLRVLEHRFTSGVAVLTDDDVCLDVRLSHSQVSVTFDGTDTNISTPFPLSGDDAERITLVIAPSNTGSDIKGRVYKPSVVSGSNLKFHKVNLQGQQFFLGVQYKFLWKPSPIYMRDRNQVAIQDGRLQLRKVSLLYNNSGPFETRFTPTGSRQTYVSQYSGWIVGSPSAALNKLTITSGEYRVSVNGAAEQLDLEITAWTPWRVRFSSLEWDGRWRPRKRRTT